MIPPLLALLVLVAFICTILSVTSPQRCPLWVGVLLLCVAMMVMVFPK